MSNPIFNSSSEFNRRGPVVQQTRPVSGPPGPDPRFGSYGQPGQYAQPGQPGQNAQPGQPGQNAQPGQPGQPGQYAQPGQPGQPGQYAQPGQYGQSAQYAQHGAAGAQAADAGALEQMYGYPTATTADTGRMTYDDVIMKTAGLLTVLLVAAAATWYIAPELFFVGMIVGLVLGLVNAFKRTPSPALIVAYAIAEGVFLGGISYFVENSFGTQGGVELGLDSIVLQALLATAATFVATLLLFTSGKVRVTPKATRFFMVAMVGYGIFSLINLGLMWFGGMDGWGLRSNVEVMGIPLGLLIGVFAVGLAAYSLIMDFDSIKRGVERGVPARFAWTAAFGLVVTLVWLYLEFLRILAILRNN